MAADSAKFLIEAAQMSFVEFHMWNPKIVCIDQPVLFILALIPGKERPDRCCRKRQCSLAYCPQSRAWRARSSQQRQGPAHSRSDYFEAWLWRGHSIRPDPGEAHGESHPVEVRGRDRRLSARGKELHGPPPQWPRLGNGMWILARARLGMGMSMPAHWQQLGRAQGPCTVDHCDNAGVADLREGVSVGRVAEKAGRNSGNRVAEVIPVRHQAISHCNQADRVHLDQIT